jgi:hypothetical protein
MSRRHHGRPRQHDRAQPGAPTPTGSPPPRAVEIDGAAAQANPSIAAQADPSTSGRPTTGSDQLAPIERAPVHPPPEQAAVPAPPTPSASAGVVPPGMVAPAGVNAPPRPPQVGQLSPSQATAPQLRRFIKSRPYVPMHELRRRFAIDGGDDDVTPVHIDRHWIFVGLPAREGGLLGELLRAGEIGYELSLDPRSPIVVGVYPMRPAPRP